MKPKDSNILDTNNLYKGLIMIQPIEIKNKIWTFLETLKTLENLKFLVLPLNKDPILVITINSIYNSYLGQTNVCVMVDQPVTD